MDIYVDIDNTITITRGTITEPLDYSKAIPLKERIQRINKLYEKGHKITYWTARGTKTKIDWTELTKKQLKDWGAKYHNLKMGKPAFDIFIDDKAFNSNYYFNEIDDKKIIF